MALGTAIATAEDAEDAEAQSRGSALG
jgi:hypothetical protein